MINNFEIKASSNLWIPNNSLVCGLIQLVILSNNTTNNLTVFQFIPSSHAELLRKRKLFLELIFFSGPTGPRYACLFDPNLLNFLKSVFSFYSGGNVYENMPLTKDLLHPSPEEEKRKHKKKCLVQSPNSYFRDVKCPGCYKIATIFSHAQIVVLCVGCSTVLCQPTGGKARLTEGCSFRWK
uniref:40S ribosomal protein S27 n=2 Tax=Sus scrofa TaxID=9823 RepID=A0A4X1VJK0_PIG